MRTLIIFICFLCSTPAYNQFDSNQLGSWQMHFVQTTFKDSSFGIQGDLQLRNWDILGSDLEQTIVRAGITYKHKKSNTLFTLGYATMKYGAFGESKVRVNEDRIYQEALHLSKPLFNQRLTIKQRFRFEQKFTGNIGFRIRLRYKLQFCAVIHKSLYFSVYDELFINGMRETSRGFEVNTYDRNRFYTALGYKINENLKFQFGIMNQSTNNWRKNQLQISCHHII